MPVLWDDETQDKNIVWDDERTPHQLEQEQAEILSRPAVPAWEPIKKEEPPGFFKSFGRGAVHPFEATGRGAREFTSDDDLLTRDLMTAAEQREHQNAPTTAGKVGAFLGNLTGSAGQSIATAAVTGPLAKPALAATFGSAAYHDEFLRAGLKAIDQGKSIDEAVQIGKKAARVGGGAGAVLGAVLPKGTTSLGEAVKEGLKTGVVAGAGQLAENIAERSLGLKTPVLEDVLAAGGTMALLPPVTHGLRAGARYFGEAPRAVPMPPEAGPYDQTPRQPLQLRAPPIELPQSSVGDTLARVEGQVSDREFKPLEPRSFYPEGPETRPERLLQEPPSGKRPAQEPPPIIGEEPVIEGNAELILPERLQRNSSRREFFANEADSAQKDLAKAEKAGDPVAIQEQQLRLRMVQHQLQNLVRERQLIVRDFEGSWPPTGEQLGTFQSKGLTEHSETTYRAEPERLPKAEQPPEQTRTPQKVTPEEQTAADWPGDRPVKIGEATLTPHPPESPAPEPPLKLLGDSPQAIKDHLIEELQVALQGAPGEGSITINYGKGTMTVKNTVEAISSVLDKVRKLKVNQKPPGIPKAALKVEPQFIAGTELEAWADKVLGKDPRERTNLKFLPFDHEVLMAAAVKGAAMIERGLRTFGEWSKRMLSELGVNIKPHLERLWTHAQDYLNQKQKLGISPGATAARAVTDRLKEIGQSLKVLKQRGTTKESIAATRDGVDSESKVIGQQKQNDVLMDVGRNIPKTEVRLGDAATTFIVQANGSQQEMNGFLARINQYLTQPDIPVSSRAAAMAARNAIQYGLQHWQQLQAGAARVTSELTRQHAYETANGMNVAFESGYVPQRWEPDLFSKDFVLFGERGVGHSGQFRKAKVFRNYVDGITADYVPRTLRASELVGNRVAAGQRLVRRDLWVDGLKAISDPTTHDPVAANPLTDRNGQLITPDPSYELASVRPGKTIAIRRGYNRLFDAMTARSQVADSALGHAALNTAGMLKHGLLLLDTFHVSRVLQTLAASGNAKWRRALSVLEYSDSALDEAVRQGYLTDEARQWARGTVQVGNTQMPRRELANKLVASGLNVGRIQDALYSDVVSKIPGIGTANRWVFDKLTRGAMLQTALSEAERIGQLNPAMPLSEILSRVRKDTNILYGNLGRQGIIKNPAIRDLMQIAFLAPQWVESLMQKEARFAYRSGEAGVRFMAGKPVNAQFGTIGKTIGTGLAAYFFATQLTNLITRGHTTFENPEEGHKLDAWIPGGKSGFFISPLSVFAETTHDVLRYSENKPTVADAIAQIGANKIGPLARALITFLGGHDSLTGQKIAGGSWARVAAAMQQLNPTPIGLQPVVKKMLGGDVKPGQVQRQLMSSVGLKTEVAPSANQQMRQKASDWMEHSSDPRIQARWQEQQAEQPHASKYQALRSALLSSDTDEATKQYESLLDTVGKSRTDARALIAKAMQHSGAFTANVEMERKFKRSLTPKELELYKQAIAERKEIAKRFLQMKKTAPH